MNIEHVVIDDDNDSIETVIIPDDDTPIDQNSNNKANIIDTIILDTESPHQNGTDIEINEISNNKNLLQSHSMMSELVEKCLNMEFSEGMTRVIYKTVLPQFRDADKNYKHSAKFRRLLKRTLRRLEMDPNHKFSHIKSLCDALKSNKPRKKVPFITLSSKVTNRRHQNTQANYNAFQVLNVDDITNTTKTDVIVLDNSDKESVISVDNNDLENDVILVEESTNSGIPTSINHSNKENDKSNAEYINSNGDIETNNIQSRKTENVDNDLLLPKKQEVYQEESVTKRVKHIERTIANYKQIIVKLEGEEVTDNSESSPYILCDMYKNMIVRLYRELCTLVGQEPVKRHEVRLKVTSGHRPGPVKRLEDFLNGNIDSTGSPPFPDFCDVVNCVIEANVAEGLRQSKAQVVNEAVALFKQCGQALRKRRQKREWRDLMSLVTPEEPDGDPAEADPELFAKLEVNKRIAELKEHEILERYTRMEYHPSVSALNHRLNNTETRVPIGTDSASESDDPSKSESEHRPVESAELPNNENSMIEPIHNDIMNTSSSMHEIVNNSSSVNVVNSAEISEVLQRQVKQEPADIQNLLDGLGSDYTVTVFDIEDPFLVIEISSDSSDSDDDL